MAQGTKRTLGCAALGCLGIVLLGGVAVLATFLVAGAGGFAWYAAQSDQRSAPSPVTTPHDVRPAPHVVQPTPASSATPEKPATETAPPPPEEPVTDGTPAPASAPAPKTAPAPVPAPQPTVTPKPAPKLAPAKPSGPTVTVEGNAKVVLISASGKRYSVPGTVPAGTYEIEATFSDGVPVKVGKMRVDDGAKHTVRCNEAMGICRGS